MVSCAVQTGERTTDRGTNSASNIKRLCNGKYRPGQLYILSSRVAPDTTDADVHALCTKPAVLKMKESGKSPRKRVLLIEKRILPGIIVVDKCLFCLS
jgi:hypothetical protein